MNKNVIKKYRLKTIAVLAAIMLVFTGCSANAASAQTNESGTITTSQETVTVESKSEMFTERDLSGDYDESSAVSITLSGNSASVNGSGAEADGSTITITQEGVYVVSGTLTDGAVV